MQPGLPGLMNPRIKHKTTSLPTPEQISDFTAKLSSWVESELKLNPSNEANIKHTKNRFINYFSFGLDILTLTNLGLYSIPQEIGHLTKLKKLDLSHNQLEDLPNEIFKIDNLEILNLSSNRLSQLPVDKINKLENLRVLNASGNKFKKDFDFKLPNASIILENPQSLNDFFLLLTFYAQFSEIEKISDYNTLLDDNFFKNNSRILDSSSPQILKDLLSRLQEMNEYFTLDKLPAIHSESQRLISTLTKSLNRFLYESASQKKSNQNQKKIIARELLTICSQIFEKKDDPVFFKKLDKIFLTELDKGHEDNIALMIFNLKNLCNKLNFQEFSNIKIIPLFKYFKRQLIFCYINKIANECASKIARGNNSDSMECKIFLNFFRILNQDFGKELSLNLPTIIDQASGKIKEYQPADKVINQFYEIISDDKKLCSLLANQLSEEIYDGNEINISEICEFNFIKKLKEKVDEIAKKNIEELKKLRIREVFLEEKIIKNLQYCQKTEFARLICDQFLELAKNKQPVLAIDTEKIIKNFSQTYRQALHDHLGIGEPTTILSARNRPNDRPNRNSSSFLQEESSTPQPSPNTRSSISKCLTKCLAKCFPVFFPS